MGCGKNLADDDLLSLAVLRDEARITVFEAGKNFQNVLSAIDGNLAALVTETLAHLRPERRRRSIDDLHPALPRARLPVRDDPDVSGDSGVVEELLRKRN